MDYVPLWCKSNYSFLEGASHPEELVKAAVALGLPALVLSDRNGVYGAVRAHEAAKEAGLSLVLGAQVTLAPGTNLVLVAEDTEGWASLCALLTAGHRDQPKGSFRLTAEQVAQRPRGLTALWQGVPEDPKVLGPLVDALGGRMYALVPRHRWWDDPGVERGTRALAQRFHLPLVAATEVLYHHPDRQELQDVVTSIRHGVRLVEAGTRIRPNASHGLLTPQEFQRLYADEPTWVSRTFEVAERCHFSLGQLQYRYPVEGVPEGYTTSQWLRKLTAEGMAQRYSSHSQEALGAVRRQVDKELGLIEELGYDGYFLTMHELVQYCRSQGILCQGRGSAANSAVCFCLGITAVDPVRMDLLFERFLSRERAEPPDIDLDIEHNRREEVIQYLYRRYGRQRAAMVANVIRYRSRSALREVGKVLGIPAVDLDRCSKLISHHEGGLEGVLVDAGLRNSTSQRMVRLAKQLQGFPRHLSIHPGGFLLGTEALDRLVPVENATMADRTVIQWDKTDVEAMSLFKVDLLGLGALTHLDYAFRLLKAHRGIDLSMADIPADDGPTFDLIERADTIGVFQIESRAQMSMLPRLKPRSYYDLVVEVSLVRPGPITGGMVHPYLRRRQGVEEVIYPHPLLEPVLKKTLGVPLFQEQVMKLAMVAADYSPGEADQLRRDMAAWKSTGRIDEHHDKLVTRMVAKGIEADFAERVFQQIRGFGEYGFPESHAASFALIAYATAWVKAHHPDVFACALLNAWPMGFYSPASILGDARRHRVPLLPVDVGHSDWDCTLEPVAGSRLLGLRVGMRYVKGLGRGEADAILSQRTRSSPLGLAEWKSRSRVSREAWEKLAEAGALAGLGMGRRDALWTVLGASPLPFDTPEVQGFSGLSAEDEVMWDYQSQGHSTRDHLLGPLRPRMRRAGYPSAVEVNTSQAPSVRYAGLVTCRQRPGNAKGVLFLTLEDETGMVNVVVWENVWLRYRRVILTSPLLGVEGKLQVEDGVVHVIARRLWSPDLIEAAEIPHQSHDFH